MRGLHPFAERPRLSTRSSKLTTKRPGPIPGRESDSNGSDENKAGQGLFFDCAAPLDAGYQWRLYDRFGNRGAIILSDYELLELNHFGAFPRCGANALAKRLIARLVSFAEVIAEPQSRLKEIEDDGDTLVTEVELVCADTKLTQQIVAARNLLGITVHDQIIVHRDGHPSLRALNLV